MYVTEFVNIPEELERQLKRDRLVLFVGAGAPFPLVFQASSRLPTD